MTVISTSARECTTRAAAKIIPVLPKELVRMENNSPRNCWLSMHILITSNGGLIPVGRHGTIFDRSRYLRER